MVILCGGMLKIVSISLHMGTDVVRENFLLVMVVVAITMAICSMAYEAVVRVAPWMVGKKKSKGITKNGKVFWNRWLPW